MVILQVVYSKYVTQKKLCENTNLCIFTNLILYASSHTKNRILFSCQNIQQCDCIPSQLEIDIYRISTSDWSTGNSVN
jgi:hypothetical protein